MSTEQPDWAINSDVLDGFGQMPPRKKNKNPLMKRMNKSFLKFVWFGLAVFGVTVGVTVIVFGIRFLHLKMEIAENQTKAETARLEATRLKARQAEDNQKTRGAADPELANAVRLEAAPMEVPTDPLRDGFLEYAEKFEYCWNDALKKLKADDLGAGIEDFQVVIKPSSFEYFENATAGSSPMGIISLSREDHLKSEGERSLWKLKQTIYVSFIDDRWQPMSGVDLKYCTALMKRSTSEIPLPLLQKFDRSVQLIYFDIDHERPDH